MNLKRSSSPPSKSSSLAPTTIAKPSSVGKYASASNLTKLCNPRSGSLMMKPSSSSDIKVPLNPKTKNLTSVCRKSSNPDSTTASRKSVVVNSSSSRDSNGFSHATRNSKPSSPVATRKIATSLINKNLTKKLPSDVVLTILDFMVEICSKVLSKDGTKIKYSQFIRKFYGRFAVDKSTRFLFRFMNINHDEISNLDLNIALIGIPVISSCDRKVRLSKESVNYLFNHPHMYANPLSENLYHIELPDFRKRLYNFVALLGESNCKKIQELDLSQCELDLDTVELAIRSFTNLSVLKGRTDIYYSPKWYCEAPIESSFTDSMAEAFEEGGKNLKVFVWSASDFSTIVHQHTPNIEVLYLELTQRYERNAFSMTHFEDSIMSWSNLKEIHINNMQNNCPIIIPSFSKIFCAFNNMKNLRVLKIFGEHIPFESFEYLMNNQTLKSLSLKHCGIEDKFIDVISTISNLEKLNITGSKLSKESLFKLAELKNLTSLELIYSNCIEQAEPVSKITTLKQLAIEGLIEENSHYLLALPNLEKLGIWYSILPNKVLEEFCEKLLKLKGIRLISCNGVNMTTLIPKYKLKVK